MTCRWRLLKVIFVAAKQQKMIRTQTGKVQFMHAARRNVLDSTRTLAHAIHSRVRTMTSLRSKDTLYVYHIHDWSSPSFSKEMTVYWQSRKHDRQKKVTAYRFPGNIILQLKKLWPLCKLALCLSHVWTPSEGGGPTCSLTRTPRQPVFASCVSRYAKARSSQIYADQRTTALATVTCLIWPPKVCLFQ